MDITKALQRLEQRLDKLEKKQFVHQRYVEQYDLETGKAIAQFASIRDAERALGITNISRAAHGHSRHMGGFGWRFLDDEPVLPGKKPGQPVKRPEDVVALVEYVREHPDCFAFETKKLVFDGNHTRNDRAIDNACSQGFLTKTCRGVFITLRPVGFRGPTDASGPPTENFPPVRPVAQPSMRMPRNRATPRWFPQPTREDVFRVMDLALQGKTNHEIADVVGISPGMAGRLRGRSRWASNYWPFIDEWISKHPGVVVRSERQVARSRK